MTRRNNNSRRSRKPISRQKRYSRYARKNTNVLYIPRPIITPNVIVKLPYVATFKMTKSSGFVSHTFRLNSLFDIDRTGGGHQNLGFDEWCTFFQRYVVLNTHVTFNIIPSSGSATVGMLPTSSATLTNNLQNILEHPESSWAMMPADGTNTVKLRRNFNLRKHYGVPTFQQMMLRDDISALCSASPSEVLNLILYIFDSDDAQIGSTSYIVNVRFMCTTLFFDLVSQLSSS